MSIRPCDSRVDCSGSDFPLRNLSSEGPDLPQYSATGFCCNGAQAWAFSLVSQENADDALFRLLKTSCPECTEARQYCAEAKCPDGTMLAKYCSPISQEVVDEWAAQREALMLPFCDDTGQLFSATCACPDGSNPITMLSPFSVDDALAACESVPKDCPPPCNDEQSCAVTCPDGTEFTFVQPACTIYGTTLAEANATAHALACLRAQELRICLGPIDLCACEGEAYVSHLSATGVSSFPIIWDVIGGSLPPGLTLEHITNDPTALISGTPTASGQYVFNVRALLLNGSYAVHTYLINVIVISTTSLPSYTLGTAYSYQLTATGGSGNYAWAIVSGTLPTGLSMSLTGLISGTPTAAGTSPLVFEVTDTTCEALNRSYFPPTAKLITVGTTILKIKRGYPEYLHSTGALYKKITWTGNIVQTATAAGQYCGGAQYVYSGSSEINANGVFISHHIKNRYSNCIRAVYPPVGDFLGEILGTLPISRLIGYCWAFDPNSCPTCSTNAEDWGFEGNFATDSPTDPPTQMLTDPNGFVRTATTFEYDGTRTELMPITDVNNLPSNAVQITAVGLYQAVLSDPYTDADATASQQTISSSLSIAENKPDYQTALGQQFLTLVYSRTTEVAFTIECKKLVAGQNYKVTYQLVDDDGAGHKTTTLGIEIFTATGASHDVTGTVPVPAVGHTTQIKNAKIEYL